MSETFVVAKKSTSPLDTLRRRFEPARASAAKRLAALKAKAGEYVAQPVDTAKKNPWTTLWIILGIAAIIGLVVWGIAEWNKDKKKKDSNGSGSTMALGAPYVGMPTAPYPGMALSAQQSMTPGPEALDSGLGAAMRGSAYCDQPPYVKSLHASASAVGSGCGGLGPGYREQCKINKLNKMAAGACDQLEGCERKVCEELFEEGMYPRPMTYQNVPPQDYLLPSSFSRYYPKGWQQPPYPNPLWGQDWQETPIAWDQGDLSEFNEGYLEWDKGALELTDPYAKSAECATTNKCAANPKNVGPHATQSPPYNAYGAQGLHEFGTPIGMQTFTGQ